MAESVSGGDECLSCFVTLFKPTCRFLVHSRDILWHSKGTMTMSLKSRLSCFYCFAAFSVAG